MNVKLVVIKAYESGRGKFAAGKELEVSQEEADWFMRDAPTCFKIKPVASKKALDEPLADKMLKRPEAKK